MYCLEGHLKEDGTVGAHAGHADRLVEADRRGLSARTKRQTRGTRSSSSRTRSRSPRCAYPCPRTSGSTQTCWSWTAWRPRRRLGLEEDRPSSVTQIHERPSSICCSVRRRKPSASAAIGSRPSSPSCVATQAGRSSSKSSASPRGSGFRRARAPPRSRRPADPAGRPEAPASVSARRPRDPRPPARCR